MRIAISSGDPCGIGPEIVIKALQQEEFDNHHFVIYGLSRSFDCLYDKFSLLPPLPRNVELIDVHPSLRSPELGFPCELGGQISFLALDAATKAVANGECDVLVTAPINKYAWSIAGYKFTGHTTYLCDFFKPESYAMAFVCGDYKLVLQTIHLPLSKVSERITEDEVYRKILRSADFLRKLGQKLPIAVLGLNPHAGEQGRIGQEEEIIDIAVRRARAEGIDCDGPFVPDAFFTKWQDKPGSLVLAMYHDQGLIPFKMISGGAGVNITLGLPIIRTSPDHGTAMDIADRCIANPNSMIEAINMAIRLKDL